MMSLPFPTPALHCNPCALLAGRVCGTLFAVSTVFHWIELIMAVAGAFAGGGAWLLINKSWSLPRFCDNDSVLLLLADCGAGCGTG